MQLLKLQTIICMKWGVRYNYNYVNNLYDSIKRHTNKKTQLICFTDDQTNIKEILRKRPLEKEEVTNPTHYNERKMEPLDYIIANELDFLEGNIIKYITRYTYKGGVNDLLKARTYLEKLIERERDGR